MNFSRVAVPSFLHTLNPNLGIAKLWIFWVLIWAQLVGRSGPKLPVQALSSGRFFSSDHFAHSSPKKGSKAPHLPQSTHFNWVSRVNWTTLLHALFPPHIYPPPSFSPWTISSLHPYKLIPSSPPPTPPPPPWKSRIIVGGRYDSPLPVGVLEFVRTIRRNPLTPWHHIPRYPPAPKTAPPFLAYFPFFLSKNFSSTTFASPPVLPP